MIQPIRGKGVNRATAICDGCSREETVTCDYARDAAGGWHPNEGQITKKLVGRGWAVVKRAMHCPACEAKRKMETRQETAMKTSNVTVAPIREPSREEKRQIMGLLEVSYDATAGRYKGTDTDQTVAAAIGGGVMSGWVAEIREEFFGPDGGNGEMDALLTEMRAWVKEREREKQNAMVHLEAAQATLRECDAKVAEVSGFAKRLDAIRAAVGPKAARA